MRTLARANVHARPPRSGNRAVMAMLDSPRPVLPLDGAAAGAD
jgi:hypothetical protein